MPDLFKPLFNPNLLKSRMTGFADACTPEQLLVAGNWARTAADPAFRSENEKPFQGQFLTDIFGDLLGYVLPAGHLDAYNLKAESASNETKGGKTPDGRLGFFGPERDTTRVVIELKAPGADLDAKQPGHGNLTPVEQAFGYLAKFDDCRWVIVSNFTTLRLYSKSRGQGYAHDFALAELANPDVLRLFLFLLGRERLMAEPPARSLVDTLLDDSCNREQQITRDFYALFSAVRLQLFQHLRDANPPPGGTEPAAHQVRLLASAQKILDRILFICFCEDTGLLPHGIIRQAFGAAGSGFVTTTRWQQLCGLFHAVDKGSPSLKITGYNGGLFRADSALEALIIADEVLTGCLRLADHDFATEVNVNILGHIFEQSITDLETIRAQIRGQKTDASKSQRKLGGIFYTPEFITQYIVSETIGTCLRERFNELQTRHHPEAARTPAKQLAARIAMWEEYQTILRHLRVLDLACGSGAFLVAAFDYLRAEHVRTNEHLAALRGGQPELFDLDREILTRNLFGVDISPESVEITKLSLWLKTARQGKPLNELDATIRCGNSIVSPTPDLPAELAGNAFAWQAQFPEVFAAGGFDCVIGNPPYIRQEWLGPCKPAFEREFQCYAGTADAYLYFIERGLQLLRPGGRLGFITSGTFGSANFAAPFRAWLPSVARFARVVNFGENQPFADAEMVFPTISILEKLASGVGGGTVMEGKADYSSVPPFRTYFMREGIPDSIADAVASEGTDCDASVFARPEWRFQPAAVTALFDRLMAVGRPLAEVVEGRIYYGVKTGLNEAFIVDQATRDRLVATDPGCAPILRKMLRGEDLRPWYQEDEGRFLIVMPNGFTRQASGLTDEAAATAWLTATYPALAAHLAPFAESAQRRTDKGEFWWELRSCDYYAAFDQPKILWPDIAKLPRFSWDTEGAYVGNTGYIMSADPWFLALLRSRVIWFSVSQLSTPLRLRGGLWQFRCIHQFMARLPVPATNPEDREVLARLALEATATARERYALHGQVRHRLLADFATGRQTKQGTEGDRARSAGVEPLEDTLKREPQPVCPTLNTRLAEWWTLDFASFRSELRKGLKAEIAVKERQQWEEALAGWRGQHDVLTARLVVVEQEIDDRVCQLFGLSTADRRLLADHARQAMIDYPDGAW